MIVGDRNVFAIESSITKAFSHPGQRALGYFVIHVRGEAYGVKKPDASLLACSLDEVIDRLGRRGTHQISNLLDVSASMIVEAYLDAIYRDTKRTDYFVRSRSEFSEDIYGNKASWAPDGDQAFDDGSHILQFDIDDRVRLIAFRNRECLDDVIESIAEECIESDRFYDVLSSWSETFLRQWSYMKKESGAGPVNT